MISLIEMDIKEAVRKLLLGRVNEILNEYQFMFGVFEDGLFKSNITIVPVINITKCERTEKERIICIDAYSLTISLSVPENDDSEYFCYGYSHAIDKALKENPTLGGKVDKAIVTDVKVLPPKVANCGMEWEATVNVRITVEGMNDVSSR